MIRQFAVLAAVAALAACSPEAAEDAAAPGTDVQPTDAEMAHADVGMEGEPATLDPVRCAAIGTRLEMALDEARADSRSVAMVAGRYRNMVAERMAGPQGLQVTADAVESSEQLTPEELRTEFAVCEAGVDGDFSGYWGE